MGAEEGIEDEAVFNKTVLLLLKGMLRDLKEINGKEVSKGNE